MIRQSYTVETHMEISTDSFNEILLSLGFQCIKLTKLDKAKFLFTFLEEEDLQHMSWPDVKIWVKAYSKTRLLDLVKPRLAWLSVFGLPFLLTCDEIIEELISPIGKRLFNHNERLTGDHVQETRICISTTKFEKIEIQRKIKVEGQIFPVTIREEEFSHIIKFSENSEKENRGLAEAENSSSSCSLHDEEFPADSNVKEGAEIIFSNPSYHSEKGDDRISDTNSLVERDPIEDEMRNRNDRVQNWNGLASPAKFCSVSTVWGMRDDNTSSSDKQSINRDIVESSRDNLSPGHIEITEEQNMADSFDRLRLARKGGRTRKIKQFNFFEFNSMRRGKTKGSGTAKQRKKKNLAKVASKHEQVKKGSGINESTKITEADILNVGKELGLVPMFSDNDTLSIILHRLKRKS